jgi:hypothetical protein
VRLALTLLFIPALFLLQIVKFDQLRELVSSLAPRRNPS